MDVDKLSSDAAAYSRMWMDFTTRLMTAGMSFNPATPPMENAEQIRKAMLGAVTEYFDTLMRSPQFLEMMKQSMDNAMAFRQRLNETMTAVHHDAQAPAREDLDSLMGTIRHMGSRIFDRLDELETRLDSISQRLDGLQPSNGQEEPVGDTAANGEDRPPRRKTPSRKSRGGASGT